MSVPWLVLSPHCDDAVFSCGALLAMHPGSIAVTVFAGTPAAYEPFTEWDRACGYAPGDDVMASRREEDARALETLRCVPRWLPFLDGQYGPAPGIAAIAEALEAVMRDCAPQRVAFPLGLFHSDHVLVREAALALAARDALPPAVVYSDALYRRIPGAEENATVDLERRGFRLDTQAIFCSTQAQELKRAAIACYGSQLRGLATPGRLGPLDAYAPESYRRLALTADVA